MPCASANITLTNGTGTAFPELDYCTDLCFWTSLTAPNGCPTYVDVTNSASSTTGNAFSGNIGSSCYASAIDLETSNGVEISGLNAEEQSDIAFIANWSAAQANFNLEVYSFYDAMVC